MPICWPRRLTLLDDSRYDRFAHASRKYSYHTHRAQLSHAAKLSESLCRFSKMMDRFCVPCSCPELISSVAYQWGTLTRIFYLHVVIIPLLSVLTIPLVLVVPGPYSMKKVLTPSRYQSNVE